MTVGHREGSSPVIRTVVVGREHEATAEGVVVEGVAEVELLVAVVATAGHEHHAQVAELLHFLSYRTGAVEVVHPIQSPAHVDDEAFLLFLCHAVHPFEGVNYRLFIGAEGGEDELGLRCHAAVDGAGAATACDGGDVRAVVMVTVDVGSIAGCSYQLLTTYQFSAVVEAGRRGSRRAELVPCP